MNCLLPLRTENQANTNNARYVERLKVVVKLTG